MKYIWITILLILLCSCKTPNTVIRKDLYLNDSVSVSIEIPHRTVKAAVREVERTRRVETRYEGRSQLRELRNSSQELRNTERTRRVEVKEQTKQKRVVPDTLKYILGILVVIVIFMGILKFKKI